MTYVVRPNSANHAPESGVATGYLWTDNWDDWFTYNTLYYLTYFDRAGQKHEIGQVKIGEFGWPEKQRRPALPKEFVRLPEQFFSLGQDVDYYKALMEIDEEERSEILTALRDVAADQILYARALEEDVMKTSLMRSSSARNVEIQYRRVLDEGVELTPYEFSYRAAKTVGSLTDPVELEFKVKPGAFPPTNIHVLVGRNGVGKTRLLNGMTRALVDDSTTKRRDGSFSFEALEVDLIGDADETFANLVSVTFSAFDEFLTVQQTAAKEEANIGYENVGLRKLIKREGKTAVITQNIDRLASDFAKSVRVCAKGVRRKRWRAALQTLETDNLFAEIGVAELAEIEDEEAFVEEAKALYGKLSSGHKIVLLTTTRLVELVEERTLVLMDEPEAHLHPPLLAAFVRALSDLLTNRNGVAIIATHSPVVVQEVPASCVWKIARHGLASVASRPEIETFAEAVNVLTREVFGLEVDRSGFHRIIGEIVAREHTFEGVMARFDDEIGGQGQALIRALLAQRGRRNG